MLMSGTLEITPFQFLQVYNLLPLDFRSKIFYLSLIYLMN